MDANDTTKAAVARGPFLLGLFLVTSCTLALEVLLTRLLSVITWYSLAFLVIGMGMFGLTAGAVQVYLRSDEYEPERLASSLARDAALFAALTPIGYVLLLIVPLRVSPVWTTVALFLVFAAIIALPFVAAGRVVAAAVTRTSLPTGLVYAVDLAGAAAGAPVVPELLEHMSAGTAIIVVGAAAALGAACFARAGADDERARKFAWLAAGIAALALANGTTKQGLVPLWSKGKAEEAAEIDYEAWNSHSRVQVSRVGVVPASLWGAGAKCNVPPVRQRMIVIDADAATPLYQPERGLEELRFLDCDVTNLAHHIRPGGAMAIIGVGGSRDIQAALLAKHEPVVGIELNRRLLEILKGPLGEASGVATNPSVKLVHDEARSHLTRTTQRFRVIQASLIDTWAATGAGAHALGENGLYTVEAWSTFLDRLEPGGVVTMSRWSSIETVRLIGLAVAALLDRGAARPRDHIALAQGGPVTTIVVGREPLTEEDVKTLAYVSDTRGFRLLVSPHLTKTSAQVDAVLDAKSRAELDAVTQKPQLDFRPTTDDRPFFFNVVKLSAFAQAIPTSAAGTIEGNRMATTALVLSLVASVLLSAIAIVVPLWRRAKPEGRVGSGLVSGLFYFALIGVGFMLCEVGLLQRLSLVLGHPAYSLIVVLASLVATAGLGSLFSDKLPLDRAPYCYVFPVLIAGVMIALSFGLPHVAPSLLAMPTRPRIALTTALVASVGFVLGLAFPAGMRIYRSAHKSEAPWLWGVNGVGGVVASSAAVMIALEGGLRWLFLASAACYALLLPAIWVELRDRAKVAAETP